MTTPFLEDLALRIIKDHELKNLHDVWVVLPSRRAGLFLRKYLLKNIKKPFLSPRIITINELVEEIAGAKTTDSTILLFELYETYRQTEKEKAESFELFSKWGQIMLNDFNEIDRYLVDTKTFFRDLRNIQEIEDWSFNEDKLSESQEKYLSFWKQMGEYYNLFSQHCEHQKIFSSGKIYRIAAGKIEISAKNYKNNSIYIAGFNAISRSEEKIIDELCNQNKAVFLTDSDEWYASDKNHEAGTFIRQLQNKKWFANNPLHNHFKTSQKEIFIYEIPGDTLQAETTGQILSRLSENELTETVVVLADEQLLLPVIHALPENVSTANITMGYSLKNTTLYTFIASIFEFQTGIRTGKNGEIKYYVPDVLNILNNAECQAFSSGNSHLIAAKIIQTGKSFLNPSEFGIYFNNYPELKSLFIPWEKSNTFILNYLLSILDKLDEIYAGNRPLQKEFVFIALQALSKLRLMLEKYPFVNEVRSLQKLCLQILKNETVPFYGEPLKGLQILGMLESRALDFKNIILLSANEDILPKGNNSQSIIPYDLKRYHHLPTFHETDAVFAHHFYRLIQRAESIHLLYNSEGNLMGGGEKSRFVLQIEEEFKPKLKNIQVRKLQAEFPSSEKKSEEFFVKNNPKIIEKVKELFSKGLSPSAISTYLECPLDFYYQYIIGIREKEINENLDASQFGTIIHETLHQLYQPYLGVILDDAAFTEMESKLEETAKIRFNKTMPYADYGSGKNYLGLNVIQKYCKHAIAYDRKLAKEGELILIELEKQINFPFQVNTAFGSIEITMKGIADRIDRYNGQIRLVDYKTGYTADGFLKFTGTDELLKKPKAIQLLIYSLIYLHTCHEENITASHYGLRLGEDPELNLLMNKNKIITRENANLLTDALSRVAGELLNESLVYSHQPESKYCSFCY